MTATLQADRELATALDEAFPIPDNPHASVIQRATDARAAFEKGWLAARSLPSLPDGLKEIIASVEQQVGMGHGAWDMVSPSELVAAFRKALLCPIAAPPLPVQAEKEKP